jgi:putative FmdB family regulatory protein
MPTYEYHCQNCGKKTDFFQKITDAPLTTCPECKKETLQRGPGGGIGLTFVGSGFYVNDYKNTPPVEKKSECCPCGKNNPCSTPKE